MQTSGKISDLLFPGKIAAHFKMPQEGKARRVYIHPVPLKVAGVEVYKIVD